MMKSELPAELCLDQGFSLGEQGFEAIVRDLRELAPRTLVEFGSGISSVRFALEFPGLQIHSVEHNSSYYERIRELSRRYANGSSLTIHLRELIWQRHGAGYYLTYRPGSFPAEIDAVVIDGPPGWTLRGREACLYQVLKHLRVGGRVYLDDFSREMEKQIKKNWDSACPETFRFRTLDVGHGLCIAEKIRNTEKPGVAVDVLADSLAQGFRWVRSGVKNRLGLED